MKNLRKVLALILVVATLFSFVAMASAKTTADYADGKDVKYVEAVDVLSSIGILKGYDGKYHPNDDIDRDEMAKMIAVLRNGGEDNSALFTGANTFADVKGSWAEGYIAYAAQVGIVNGRNASTFDPDGKVTGVEVMKMLLCVLGYDAKEQGYVGANWQVNVLRDAKKSDLMAGMEGFDPYAAATRDEAAQLMFNALKAHMVVGYISENIVTITNSLYDWWLEDGIVDKDDLWVSVPDAEEGGWEFAYCNAVLSNVPLWSIFDGLLLDEFNENDCYMRPGHTWTLTVDRKVVFEKFYVNTPDYTQTAGTASDVADAMEELEGDEVYAFEVYEDGYRVTTDAINAGNGVLVEVYELGENVDGDLVFRVVVVNTYIAEVGTVSEYYNYFTLVDAAGNVLHRYELNDIAVEAGDMVLYWVCNGALEGEEVDCKLGHVDTLHAIEVVAPVATTVTEGFNYRDHENCYIIASGNTYKYAARLGVEYDANDNHLHYDDIDANGDAYDLYLDKYGYIKYLAPTAEAETEYFYAYLVEGTYSEHKHGYTVDKDGKKEWNIDCDVDMVKYGTDGKLAVEADVATVESTEGYMMDAVAAGFQTGALVKAYVDDEKVVVEDDALYADAGTKLDKDSFKLGNNLYATSKTVFMIRTKNLDGSYTYEQVTGYANLKGSYVAKNLESTGKTNVQYFLNADHSADEVGFVDYVFIDATYTHDFDTKFLLLDESNYNAFDTALKELYAKDYVSFNALINGEQAVVLIDEDVARTLETNVAKVFEAKLAYINVTKNDLPIYSVVGMLDTTAGDFVACYYNVVDGETYVRDVDNNVYKLAADAQVWTLTINADGDADVYEGYLEVESDELPAIDYCYVETDGDEITVLYRVDSRYVDAMVG